MPVKTTPDLQFVIPGANENRWSDLLASLISTDPVPISRLIGREPDRVEREVVVRGSNRASDRLDLLLARGQDTLAAIEVKLLADFGFDQLDRYHAAFSAAQGHYVLHLRQLPLTLPGPWQALNWEDVLEAHVQSQHPWVATTAGAWLDQLHTLIPHVDGETVWNDVPDGAASFELALRARVAWLHTRMGQWCQIEHDLSASSGGGAWVAAMRTRAQPRDHWVVAEVQEGLPARAWRPDPDRPYSERLSGPVVLLGLAQIGPATSSSFDWRLLHRIFGEHVYDHNGNPIDDRPWHTTAAGIRDQEDRANWRGVVGEGAPKWLGKGYGMATARTHHVCAFGARLGFPPTLTLNAIDAELQSLQSLITDMARTPPATFSAS